MSTSETKLKVEWDPNAPTAAEARTEHWTISSSLEATGQPDRCFYRDANSEIPPPYSRVDPEHSLSSARVLKYLEVTTSCSSVDWFRSQGAKVAGLRLTTRALRMNRPKPPVYHKPKLFVGVKPVKPKPVLTPVSPQRKKRESAEAFEERLLRWTRRITERIRNLDQIRLRSYEKKLEWYNDRLQKSTAFARRYEANYQVRLLKYAERCKRYLLAVEASKKLTFRKGVCFAEPANLPENPYSRLRMKFKPGSSQMASWTQYKTEFALGRRHGNQDIRMLFLQMWEPDWWSPMLYRDEYKADVWRITRPVTLLSKNQLASFGAGTLDVIFNAAKPSLQPFEEKLRRKLHQKLKNSSIHIGNLVAERKQTFDMITSTFKRILEFIKLKKNMLKAAGNYLVHPKKMADDILAFKFGVEPLANDLISLIEKFDGESDNLRVVIRTNTGVQKLDFSNDGISFNGFLEMSYVVKCKTSNEVNRTLSQYGLYNLTEVLWEVTPWSFVVDWFVPVGDWLSAQTASAGLEFDVGTRKVHLVGDFSINYTPVQDLPPDEDYLIEAEVLTCVFDGDFLQRTILEEIPDRFLPPIKSPWSWSHGIEALALAVQRIAR